ncbi:hypothetical protein [Thiospirochaeta perfilievii]|nr:hypothetical protein [Thiospirochaeta perfilievii]
MKKIVYVIIAAMALVFLVNLSAFNKNSTIKMESSSGVFEINPLY